VGVSFPLEGKPHPEDTYAWLTRLSRSRSEAKPTLSEQLTIDSEMDGTGLGELKAEEQRHKDEQWAQYKDTHPRGVGNTMNRG